MTYADPTHEKTVEMLRQAQDAVRAYFEAVKVDSNEAADFACEALIVTAARSIEARSGHKVAMDVLARSAGTLLQHPFDPDPAIQPERAH